jgi:hypothetical protein
MQQCPTTNRGFEFMTVIQIIIVFWLAGWVVSVAAYLWSSVQGARKAGLPWFSAAQLASVVTLLFTWLISLIIYIYAWIKLRSHSS